MARRVNKLFVGGLASVLVVGSIAAVVSTDLLNKKDPHKLTLKGEDAEKKGNLQTAAQYYALAADAASRKHQLDAAAMWEKAANTALALSVKETNNEQSEKDYQTARGWWDNALAQDPKYLPVLRRTLEDQHELAKTFGAASTWTGLEQRATRVIAAQPDYAIAYAYRGEAHLQEGAALTVPALQDAQFSAAEADATKAIQLDPAAEEPVAVLARLAFDRALLARARRANPAKASPEETAQREKGIKLAKDYLADHPGAPQVSIVLAHLLAMDNDAAGATSALEAANAKHPGNLEVVGSLKDIYALSDRAKAEGLLKAAVDASTSKTQAYLMLAQFYEDSGRPADAVAAWKNVLSHPILGGGLNAIKNDSYDTTALAAISWLEMDLAGAQGMQTDAGKAALAEAKTYADKLRTSKQSSGLQDMLDGRLELLRQNIPQAITYLQRADSTFTTPNNREWMRTKMTLATAYDQQQDWGLALKSVEDILNVYPGAVMPMLQRAQLLIRMARYNEALGVVEPLAKNERLPETLRKAAISIQANALSRLGNQTKANALLTDVGTPAALLQIARGRLQENDAQGAIEQVDAVLKNNPEDLDALYVGVLAAVQANQKDRAADYIARALKKAPDNTQFKLLAAAVNDSGADAAAAQMKILEAISDPVARNLSIAQLYGRQGKIDEQFASLQAAQKAVEAAGDSAPSGAMNDVVDRLFVLSLQLANRATDKAEKDKYWGQAAKYVQQAERLNLDGVKGQLYQGRLQLARGGEFAQAAVQTLEQAVAARPDTSLGHTFLGEAYASQNPPRTDAAMDQFRQAIEQRPDNLAALRSAVILLVQKGDPASIKEAGGYYKLGLQFFPRDKTLADMGDVLGDPAEAIRTREQIRTKDPNNLENVKRLALLYSRQSQPQKAIDVLRPVYDKTPDVITADFLARMYRDSQQVGEALRMYDPYIQSGDPAVKFQGYLLKGEMYRSMNNGPEAVAAFQSAIAIEPKGADEAERRLADYYFDTNEMAKAEGLYRQIHDATRGSDNKVTYRLAETLVREGKFTDADTLLRKDILARRPQDAKALVLQAVALLSQGKPNDALTVLNDILSRNPTDTDALFYRASSLLSLNKDLDVAARDLLAVRDSKAGNAATDEARLNSRLLLARVYRQARRYSEAAGAYVDVMNTFPNMPALRVDYAQFLLWLVGVEQHLAPTDNGTTAFAVRSVHAEERLRTLLADSTQKYPKTPMWAVLEGRLSAVKGDLADARTKLAAAYAASPDDPMAAAPYLDVLLASKDYDPAAQLATKLLATHPANVEYYVDRGRANAGLGKAAEARDDFDRALGLVAGDSDAFLQTMKTGSAALTPEVMAQILQARVKAHPEETVARLGLAETDLTLNRGADAVPLLTALIADPAAEAFRMQAKRAIGLAKYQAKDFQGAYDAYSEVLKSNPNDAETLNNMAYMLSEDMHKPADALGFAQRAVQALREGGPEGLVLSQGSVLDTYGWIKYRSGDKEGAITELRRAIQMEPLPVAFLHLARVYKDVGRTDEARKAVADGLRAVAVGQDPAVAELQGLKKELGS